MPTNKPIANAAAASGKSAVVFGRGILSSASNVWLLNLLLFFVVLWVFFPAVHNGFLYWYSDDPLYVSENAHVKTGFTAENVKWALTSTERSNWHPLTWMSHMLDCEIFGLKPWGHHLTSVLLHALSTALLFATLRRMMSLRSEATASQVSLRSEDLEDRISKSNASSPGPSPPFRMEERVAAGRERRGLWRCFIVALLFGLHPLRVESVAWVAERKDVLSAFFWMLTMWAYVRYAEKRAGEQGRKGERGKIFLSLSPLLLFSLSLVFFALGLMSKGMLVTLPFVFLLLDVWPLKRVTSNEWRAASTKLVLEKIPFFILAIAASAYVYAAQDKWGFVQTTTRYSPGVRLENAVISYARYLGKIFWPTNLSAFYEHPGHWPIWQVSLALIPLLAISVVAIRTWQRWPFIAVGWCWFLGTLIPVIGLVQLGDVAMANRYVYIPSIGIFVAVVWSLFELTKSWRRQAIVVAVAVSAIMICCVALTRENISYFRDSITLWKYNLAISGKNSAAQYILGLSLDKEGRTDEAIPLLKEIAAVKPDWTELRCNLGNMLCKGGNLDDGIVHYREALKVKPDMPEACLYLGIALAKKGLFDDAIVQFQKAIAVRPSYAQAHDSLGKAFDNKGQLDEAILEFQKAVDLMPENARAQNNLGAALFRKGRVDEAIAHLQEAVKCDSNYAEARKNLNVVLEAKQKFVSDK